LTTGIGTHISRASRIICTAKTRFDQAVAGAAIVIVRIAIITFFSLLHYSVSVSAYWLITLRARKASPTSCTIIRDGHVTDTTIAWQRTVLHGAYAWRARALMIEFNKTGTVATITIHSVVIITFF
jgi:ABC-type taurine transport system substrate-binding protein